MPRASGTLRLVSLLAVPVLLSGCKAQVSNSQLLDQSADGALAGVLTTGHFLSRHAWVAKYTFDCSKHQGTEGFGLDLHNGDDDSLSDQHEGWRVPGRKGQGELRFDQSGEYYFDVVSHCRWTLRVKEAA